MQRNFLKIAACAICIMTPISAFAAGTGGGNGSGGGNSSGSSSGSGGGTTGGGMGGQNGTNQSGGTTSGTVGGMGGQNNQAPGSSSAPAQNSTQDTGKTTAPVPCDPAKQAC